MVGERSSPASPGLSDWQRPQRRKERMKEDLPGAQFDETIIERCT
jgi:hypothetical protein